MNKFQTNHPQKRDERIKGNIQFALLVAVILVGGSLFFLGVGVMLLHTTHVPVKAIFSLVTLCTGTLSLLYMVPMWLEIKRMRLPWESYSGVEILIWIVCGLALSGIQAYSWIILLQESTP